MRVLVTTESRFDRTPDGTCWIVGWANYKFWQRYLDVFDHVYVLGRVRDVALPPRGSVRADGPNVSLAPVPYYVGPWAYLRTYPSLRHATRQAIQAEDAVIVRAPGAVGALVVSTLRRSGKPFGIEVVGDPRGALAPGGVRTVLRPILRRWLPRVLRDQCAQACAVAYVTAEALQHRYPARAATHVTRYSSIHLPDEAFVRESRPFRARADRHHVVFVGSLEQLYKAPDVLIDAIAAARRLGADIRLTLIGDGKHRRELEARANARDLKNRVRFLGHLPPGDPVRQELDAADVFVLPSLTEGLPRTLIEAMARALPCVGSDVGGIPELLSPTERVPAGNANVLAARILEVLRDPERLVRLSRENLHKAHEYHENALRPRRQALYRAVRDTTSHWQHSR